jgi:hypothetical protein
MPHIASESAACTLLLRYPPHAAMRAAAAGALGRAGAARGTTLMTLFFRCIVNTFHQRSVISLNLGATAHGSPTTDGVPYWCSSSPLVSTWRMSMPDFSLATSSFMYARIDLSYSAPCSPLSTSPKSHQHPSKPYTTNVANRSRVRFILMPPHTADVSPADQPPVLVKEVRKLMSRWDHGNVNLDRQLSFGQLL